MKKKPVSTRCKRLIPMIALVLMTVVLNGCASNADTLASPGPTINSTQMPGKELVDDAKEMLPSMAPDASSSPDTDIPVGSQGLTSLEEIRAASEQMEEAIDMLSEVDDAAVVAIGKQALVGIEFDSQYRGPLDERVQKMILARIQTINKSVDKIYVSDAKEQYQAIEQLSEDVEKADSLTAVTEKFNALAQKLKPYSE